MIKGTFVTQEEIMIRVAILEDEKEQAELLESYLYRYGKENSLEFDVTVEYNALNFLDRYNFNYDIVFTDIKMPYIDGMEVAENIRERDGNVIIIFVTNLVNYAVRGYKVNALDFILKPIRYYSLSLTLLRAVERVQKRRKCITVRCDETVRRIDVSDIKYVEIIGHKLVYHTLRGDFSKYGTLTEAEKELKDFNFYKCNNCYLVNFAFVDFIEGYDVTVGGEVLGISHPKKKGFLSAFLAYTKGR